MSIDDPVPAALPPIGEDEPLLSTAQQPSATDTIVSPSPSAPSMIGNDRDPRGLSGVNATPIPQFYKPGRFAAQRQGTNAEKPPPPGEPSPSNIREPASQYQRLGRYRWGQDDFTCTDNLGHVHRRTEDGQLFSALVTDHEVNAIVDKLIDEPRLRRHQRLRDQACCE